MQSNREVCFSAMYVAMIGLTHPHAAMYLETLDQLDEVDRVTLFDPDETIGHEIAARYPKADGVFANLDAVLARTDVTHAVVAVRTDQSVSALVQLIGAGKSVFAEKPTARTAAEFQDVLTVLKHHPAPFGVAYLSRWHPAIHQ
ncbi:MAG: Gfo/Idh/MocA family oxidoreductase, partial [Thermomicrobiales bacterium]